MISFIFPLFDFIAKHRWAQVLTGVFILVIIMKIWAWLIRRNANKRLAERINKETRRATEEAERYIEEVQHDYSTLAEASLDAARDAEPGTSDGMSDADYRLAFGHDRTAAARG